MNDDLEPQLRALADKYRERRFQLSKAETAEATTLCTKVLQEGAVGFDLCWQLAPYLPADSLAEAIASTWTSLDGSLQSEVIARQQRLPEAAATRLRLRSAVALRSIDAAAARRLLSSACYAMTNTPKKRPSKEQVKLFRSIMLNGDEPVLVGFAFESHTQAEIGPLLICILEVLSIRSADAQRSFSPSEPRVIEWLLQNQFFPRLTEDQRAVVVALVRPWSREIKTSFESKQDNIPEVLAKALQLEDVSQPAIEKIESVQPASAPERTAESHRNASVRELLIQVGNAVKSIETQNESVREELREKKAAIQDLRSKLSDAESNRQRVERELIETRAALDEKGTNLQVVSAELAESLSKLSASELGLAREKEMHDADSHRLLNRIEVEKKRAVDSFENRLADKLRLEWRDFESVSNLPMDTQLGESLRALVRGIFEVLEHEGLRIRN